jgi:hypothetical protein
LVEGVRVDGKPRVRIIESFGNTGSFLVIIKERKGDVCCSHEKTSVKSYTHGDAHALLKMAEKLGIEGILDKCPRKGRGMESKEAGA